MLVQVGLGASCVVGLNAQGCDSDCLWFATVGLLALALAMAAVFSGSSGVLFLLFLIQRETGRKAVLVSLYAGILYFGFTFYFMYPAVAAPFSS